MKRVFVVAHPGQLICRVCDLVKNVTFFSTKKSFKLLCFRSRLQIFLGKVQTTWLPLLPTFDFEAFCINWQCWTVELPFCLQLVTNSTKPNRDLTIRFISCLIHYFLWPNLATSLFSLFHQSVMGPGLALSNWSSETGDFLGWCLFYFPFFVSLIPFFLQPVQRGAIKVHPPTRQGFSSKVCCFLRFFVKIVQHKKAKFQLCPVCT